MRIQPIEGEFTVCQVRDAGVIDWSVPFTFASRTDGELSLTCPTEAVPRETISREDGWRAFRIEGTLDFSLVGILARIASVLAEAGISIFALSTYDTDYVLVKAERFARALKALEESGYEIDKEYSDSLAE